VHIKRLGREVEREDTDTEHKKGTQHGGESSVQQQLHRGSCNMNDDATRTKKNEIFHRVIQVEGFLVRDDNDDDPDFEGRAAATDLGGCAPPESGKACRRMTMRPSECAEKMASTTISSAVFTVARGRCCRWCTGARDVWCWC
jgi:hypothetical protein